MHKVRRTKYGITMALIVPCVVGLTVGMSPYKSVSVMVNGKSAREGTYAGVSVGQFLRRRGLHLAGYDLVEPARKTLLQSGMRIVVTLAKGVTVKNGGSRPVEVHTLARTVKTLLRTMHLSVGRRDSLNVPLDAPVQSGMEIAITRRRTVQTVNTVSIPFSVDRQPSAAYQTGTDVAVQQGQDGSEQVTVRQVFINGKLSSVHRTVQILQQPVDEVVDVGTAAPPPVVASRSDASLVANQVLTVVATAYANPGGRTATGAPAGFGDVAVDPSVIPLGTRLYIPGYGYGIADDTGGAIQGYRIDLCFNSVAQAWNFGRQVVKVYILGRAN